MTSRNVRFAQSDGASPPRVQPLSAQKARVQSQYASAPYLSQSPPRPSDITFARGEQATLYAPSHRRTPSDSASSASEGSVDDSPLSSPEQHLTTLPTLDECLEGLPSGVSRPFDCDLSMNLASSGIPSHMLRRPACDPPVNYMHIDVGITAVEVHVGNPSLGYVAVDDVLGAISASLRRPLPRDRWESQHLEFANARKKRLGRTEPQEVLLVDMLGYHHFFHGLQEGPQGSWQVIFGPRKV